MIVMISFLADERRLAALDRDGRNGLVERHVHFNHEVLEKRAVVLATRGLQPAAAAVTIRPSPHGPSVIQGSDAPDGYSFIGFYLVDCDSMEQAVELASCYPMPEGLGHIEVRPAMQAWDYGPSVEVAADRAAVWQVYADVARWPSWQAGVERVDLDGGLRTGASGTLTLVGQPGLPFRIVSATAGEGYVSETEVAPGQQLRVEHVLAALPGGRTRVTHQAMVPRAALDRFGLEFGPRFYDDLRSSLGRLADTATPHLPQETLR